MAENKDNIEVTQLDSFVKWSTTPGKSQRFAVNFFNSGYQFSIMNQGESGKFDGTRVSVVFPNFDEMAFVFMLDETIQNIKDMVNKGKTVDRVPLFIHNGKNGNIKEATNKLEIVAFTDTRDTNQKGLFSGYIRITKTNKETNKEESATFYFPSSKSIFRTSQDKKAEDFKIVTFLEGLKEKFRACASKSCISRDAHFRRSLNKTYETNNDNKKPSGVREIDDFEDELPF